MALEGLDAKATSGDTNYVRPGDGSGVVYYRLLNPDASVGELKERWADLVEPASHSTNEDIPWSDRAAAFAKAQQLERERANKMR